MSGYPNASKPVHRGDRYGEKFVTVSVSIRGTGASGGLYASFSERTIQDGYEIIEDLIVKQSWSNGKVGIHGPLLVRFDRLSDRQLQTLTNGLVVLWSC